MRTIWYFCTFLEHSHLIQTGDSLRLLMIKEQISESLVFYEQMVHSLFRSQKMRDSLRSLTINEQGWVNSSGRSPKQLAIRSENRLANSQPCVKGQMAIAKNRLQRKKNLKCFFFKWTIIKTLVTLFLNM